MNQEEVPHPPIADAAEWRRQRVALLEREKQLTRETDRLSAERRRMPMVRVEKQYAFDGPAGRVGLAELFEGRRQLVVYHFMFDPEWEKGCPGCTDFVQCLGSLALLAERDTTFALISRAPYQKLEQYKKDHGWSVPWYSSFPSDFNYDFHVTLDESVAPVEYNYESADSMRAKGRGPEFKGESHGQSVFFRLGDQVFHTYSTYARGVEHLADSYSMLDITPYGRQEDWEESPAGWPQRPTYG